MRIGIDFDEVIADSIVHFIRRHNERYGTTLKRGDFTSYVFEDIWGGTTEEAVRKVDEFLAEDQRVVIDPVKGAMEGIRALKNAGHQLYIITGRSGENMKRTEEWLTKYFPDIFDGVHYANFFSSSKDHKPRRKPEICKELGVTLLIDDNMPTVRECSAAGIKTFLLDQPWNQGEVPAGATRVHSWEEIVTLLRK